jgi:hypothetical protein
MCASPQQLLPSVEHNTQGAGTLREGAHQSSVATCIRARAHTYTHVHKHQEPDSVSVYEPPNHDSENIYRGHLHALKYSEGFICKNFSKLHKVPLLTLF